MNVLLIYPYFLDRRIDEEDVSAVPMGLYYIGATLRAAGYSTDILNAYNLKDDVQRVEHLLEEKRPDVVGFSILHANRWGGIDIARLAKKVNPEVTVVFGGPGATFLWEHLLTHFPEIDYIVRGEGEYSFMELLQWLETKPEQTPATIKGIAFRQADGPVKTANRPFIEDLDSLPMPADHFTFQHLSLTRGCPSNCTFCGSPALWKRKVRFHGAAYFVGQMAKLREKGVTFFFVSDDTFTLRRELVIDVCRRIIEQNLGITWAAISRVDCVDEEMLGWMRRAGCIQISYGVESGSRVIRDRFQKRIGDEAIIRAFDLTTRTGIMSRAYFIYGAPGESDDTIDESLALIRRIQPLAAIFYILDLFPGTRLYEEYKQRRGVTDDIWLERVEDILYFETDEELSQQAVLNFGRRLRETYFSLLPRFSREIKLSDDPAFIALHAGFLSRLGLTFSHGEYAMNPQVKTSLDVAVTLFERALACHPDHRAFWGLGLVYQQQGQFERSIEVFREGLLHHRDSEELHLALAGSLMRLNRHEEACRHLTDNAPPFTRVIEQIVRLCQFLGEHDKARQWANRI